MLHRISTKGVAPVIAILLTLGVVAGAHSLSTHSPTKVRASAAATTPAQIVLATSAWKLTFSELTSITSKIKPLDTSTGNTKQFGEPQPLTVVLKRNLDPAGNQTLNAWDQAARQGDPTAKLDLTLAVTETGGPITYNLVNAWPSKLEISGLTAGAKQPAVETVTIVCEQITVQ